MKVPNTRMKISEAFDSFAREIEAMENHMQRSAYAMDLMMAVSSACRRYVEVGGDVPTLEFQQDGGQFTPESVAEVADNIPECIRPEREVPPPLNVERVDLEGGEEYPWNQNNSLAKALAVIGGKDG